ncbi:uncharacterized protein LOC122829103 isoform X2 [Gambusia affinis]|uniref:uncharacterized protein LOC122829103 isoform X2 n=1 Tax=Gambusia affinis TaxID=33528 RepID=UPI001CDD8396|nr:uncharacterized protein LOC122829103 isoform X2 [Gambusia affinis]
MRDKSWNNLDPLREYRDKCHSLVSNLDVWQCNKVTISLPPPQPFHQPQLLFISETGGAGRPGASCRWSLKKRMSGFSPTGHDVCSRMTERSGSQHCCESAHAGAAGCARLRRGNAEDGGHLLTAATRKHVQPLEVKEG